MPRPKKNEEDKKESIKISLSKEVLKVARASGNASNWLNELGLEAIKKVSVIQSKTEGFQKNIQTPERGLKMSKIVVPRFTKETFIPSSDHSDYFLNNPKSGMMIVIDRNSGIKYFALLAWNEDGINKTYLLAEAGDNNPNKKLLIEGKISIAKFMNRGGKVIVASVTKDSIETFEDFYSNIPEAILPEPNWTCDFQKEKSMYELAERLTR